VKHERAPVTLPTSAGRLAPGMSARRRRDRRVPVGLLVPVMLVLSLIPVAFGAFRMSELVGGAEITPDNARFFADPVPVVVHIIGVSVFTIMGALQFVPRLRRRRPGGTGWTWTPWPGWHRAAGRLLVPSGLAAALSGMWMVLFYPDVDDSGPVLAGIQLVVGSAWVTSLALGYAAIRRRDIAAHRAWMTRAYAIALGTGTQALLLIPWAVVAGQADRVSTTLLMTAGWVINLVVAERAIRGRPPAAASTSAARARAVGAFGQPAAESTAPPSTDRPDQIELFYR